MDDQPFNPIIAEAFRNPPKSRRRARPNRLFISFATPDAALAKAFQSFLRLGCNLGHEQVFLTARPDELTPGTEFVEAIRQALTESAMAVLLLTPSYYESRFCLAEAGAMWASKKQRIPVIVPPIDFHNLQGVQLGEQAVKIDSASGLDVMRDMVREVFDREVPTASWNEHKDDFLNRWTTEFDGNIAPATSVPASELEASQAAAAERDRENEDLRAEAERLRRLTRDLSAHNAQLRELVPRAPPEPSLEGDERAQRFAAARAAIDVAARRMQELPAIAREALYQQFHDKRPLTVGGQLDRFKYYDASQNEQRGWVEWFEGEEQAVTPRKAKPEVEDADAALRSVREQVFNGTSLDARSEAGVWIKPFLREKYGITDPTFEIKDTWEKLGLL